MNPVNGRCGVNPSAWLISRFRRPRAWGVSGVVTAAFVLAFAAAGCGADRPAVEVVVPEGGWAGASSPGHVTRLDVRVVAAKSGHLWVAESFKIRRRSAQSRSFVRQVALRRISPDGSQWESSLEAVSATVDGEPATPSVEEDGVLMVQVPPGPKDSTLSLTIEYELIGAVDTLGRARLFRLMPALSLGAVDEVNVQVGGVASPDECGAQAGCRRVETRPLPLDFSTPTAEGHSETAWRDPERFTGALVDANVPTLRFTDPSPTVFVQGVAAANELAVGQLRPVANEGDTAVLSVGNARLMLLGLAPLAGVLAAVRLKRGTTSAIIGSGTPPGISSEIGLAHVGGSEFEPLGESSASESELNAVSAEAEGVPQSCEGDGGGMGNG